VEQLKILRTQKGVSQQKVADYLEITRQAYSNYENGNRDPDNETLLKLGEYFGVSVDYLLRGKEPAPTPGLSAKDERDIAKKLQSTLDDLENGADGLMFDGEPLDDETRALLRDSLQNQLQMTKLLAKQKFTPKKYRQ